MFIGTTYAWFNVSVSSGINRIVAGNLDVRLSYRNAAMEAFSTVEEDTETLFVDGSGGELLWEPGTVAFTYLKVENVGNLAFKYQLAISFRDEVQGDDGAALSFVLEGAILEIDESEVGTYTREKALEAAKAAGAGSIRYCAKRGALLPLTDGEEETAPSEGVAGEAYYVMIVYLPSDLEMEVDGMLYNRSDVVLKTNLGVSLVATQDSFESDGFGTDYDEDTALPEINFTLMKGTDLNLAIRKAVGAVEDVSLKCESVNSITFCEYDERLGAWADGTPVGATGGDNIRMFVDGKDVYICAQPGTRILFHEESSNMFSFLTTLKEVNFGPKDFVSTSNVKTMASMFDNCKKLLSTNVSGWDVSNVTNMQQMFRYCNALLSLDVSDWDVSNVANMNSMFRECSVLLVDPSNWDASNVTNTGRMFEGCKALTSLDLSGWKLSKVIKTETMFKNCIALTTLDLSGWDVSKVTGMNEMFYGCSALSAIYAGDWNTGKAVGTNMFLGCISLPGYQQANVSAAYAHTGEGGYFTAK